MGGCRTNGNMTLGPRRSRSVDAGLGAAKPVALAPATPGRPLREDFTALTSVCLAMTAPRGPVTRGPPACVHASPASSSGVPLSHRGRFPSFQGRVAAQGLGRHWDEWGQCADSAVLLFRFCSVPSSLPAASQSKHETLRLSKYNFKNTYAPSFTGFCV